MKVPVLVKFLGRGMVYAWRNGEGRHTPVLVIALYVVWWPMLAVCYVSMPSYRREIREDYQKFKTRPG